MELLGTPPSKKNPTPPPPPLSLAQNDKFWASWVHVTSPHWLIGISTPNCVGHHFLANGRGMNGGDIGTHPLGKREEKEGLLHISTRWEYIDGIGMVSLVGQGINPLGDKEFYQACSRA